MRKFLVLLSSCFVFAGLTALAPTAYAEHPQDNDEQQEVASGGVPWYAGGRDDPECDFDNQSGGYESADLEFWICVPDQVYPGDTPVPGQGGYYWEPVETGVDIPAWDDPDSPDDLGGDVEWSRKWVPVTIPGHPGVVMRMLSRTEWINPTGAGKCPNVTGGCKLKGGADINFRGPDGQPFQLNKTWFNRALQLYVYNATTKAWELKQDTGWTYAGSAAATYLDRWTATLNYGTAPNGAAWYFVRDQTRVWDGTAWHGTILDPKPSKARTSLGLWDPKPGQSATPTYAPKGKPKVKAPKKMAGGSALDVPSPTAIG